MQKILSSEKIYIGQSKIANADRGVFARVNIKKGEIIEQCPTLAIPKHDAANLLETILVTYFYYFGKRKNTPTLALGFGSIYNHTDDPNAAYGEKQMERLIEFIAVKDIEKDEEITVNYNQHNENDNKPMWFVE